MACAVTSQWAIARASVRAIAAATKTLKHVRQTSGIDADHDPHLRHHVGLPRSRDHDSVQGIEKRPEVKPVARARPLFALEVPLAFEVHRVPLSLLRRDSHLRCDRAVRREREVLVPLALHEVQHERRLTVRQRERSKASIVAQEERGAITKTLLEKGLVLPALAGGV